MPEPDNGKSFGHAMKSAARRPLGRNFKLRVVSVAGPAMYGLFGVAYGLTVHFVGDASSTVLFPTLFPWPGDSDWAVLPATVLVQAAILVAGVAYIEFPRRHRPHWLGRPSTRTIGLALGLAFGAIGVALIALLAAQLDPDAPSLRDVPHEILHDVGLSAEHLLFRLAIVAGVAGSFAMAQSRYGTHAGHAVAAGALMVVTCCTVLGGIWLGLAGLTLSVAIGLALGWRSRRSDSNPVNRP